MPDEINLPPPLSLKVFSNAGGICAKCGTRIDGSREQWAAVRTSSGGNNSLENFAGSFLTFRSRVGSGNV